MKRRAWLMAVGMAAALMACTGHASLTLEGPISGEIDGPGVTCPFVSSTSGSWIWSGALAGRQVSIAFTALNTTGVPDALLIGSENEYWRAQGQPLGSPPKPGFFTARVVDKSELHVEGSALEWTPDLDRKIEISGVLRCPCPEPPCR